MNIKKNFDPHVSCRLGRVTANQHIFKTRLNLYFLNQIDLNASFLMELNFINTLGLGEGGYSSSGAVTRRCSVKNAFLKISQNSHENISIKTSVLLKKRLRCRCFPVNFSKFLRTLFLQNTFGGYFCVFLTSHDSAKIALREKCQNTQLFLLRIFL